jgi:hypothetical protein
MPLEGTSRFPDTRNQRMTLNYESPLRSEGDKVHGTPTKRVFLGKEGA